MKLKLKVVPKASRNAIAGWLGDELKIMVTAAPEKGKANQAVIELLAKTLGVPRKSVTILAGHSSAHKTVELADITDQQALQRLLAG